MIGENGGSLYVGIKDCEKSTDGSGSREGLAVRWILRMGRINGRMRGLLSVELSESVDSNGQKSRLVEALCPLNNSRQEKPTDKQEKKKRVPSVERTDNGHINGQKSGKVSVDIQSSAKSTDT